MSLDTCGPLPCARDDIHTKNATSSTINNNIATSHIIINMGVMMAMMVGITIHVLELLKHGKSPGRRDGD
jgi:hypothetical protein